MNLPDDARELGISPSWIGYVAVDDVDATTDRLKHLGGTAHFPPTDIPDVGRISIIADPQSAMLALVKWLSPGQRRRRIEYARARRLA